MKKPFYSIGIIFKNEIRCLERCLKSLQPLRDAVPCEVVMADTGSSDGSREVAARYADILFDFPWIDDFAAARNAVMDQCSGQWYISVDADEWLVDGVQELKEFSQAKKLPWDFAGFHIRNFQAVGELIEDNYVDFVAVRMARLSTGVRYQGCIHEGWKDPKHELMQVMSLNDTWFHHDGYAYVDEAAQTAKRERNATLLRRKLIDNPESLQTLMECTDCIKRTDKDEAVGYVKRALDGVRKKWFSWDRFGAVVFRNAVSVAALHGLPELPQWATEAEELFPRSIYTQTDVAYYAFSYYWGKEDYSQARDWGEKYLRGMENYKAGNFESSESMWGVLENTAPLWERKVLVLMPEAYLRCGESEKAFAAFPAIKGQELEDEKQVELCTLMLIRLQRTTMLDVCSLAAEFWEQINQPNPNEGVAKGRRRVLLNTANAAFTTEYHKEERERADFLRHGCGVFAGLEGRCALGVAAAILESKDPERMTEMLAAVDNWTELPAPALIHALEWGVAFPLPSRPMNVEEMDILVARLSGDREKLFHMALRAAETVDAENWQSLLWVRGLLLAAVQSCPWNDKNCNKEQSMEVVRAFAKMEKEFLPRCYAQMALKKERLYGLPPLHRFGWYCTQAFDALDAGDATGYVRLLREGLISCGSMKAMVEFLLASTPELQTSPPPTEMVALAEQIRTVLANFPLDDPAVVALKRSEAYQKVSYLIEGIEPPVVGGQIQ